MEADVVSVCRHMLPKSTCNNLETTGSSAVISRSMKLSNMGSVYVPRVRFNAKRLKICFLSGLWHHLADLAFLVKLSETAGSRALLDAIALMGRVKVKD